MQIRFKLFFFILIYLIVGCTKDKSARDPLNNLEPCKDYLCDSLVVKGILNSNGLNSHTVSEVTDINSINNFNGRVNSLYLDNLGIGVLPSYVAKLGPIVNLSIQDNNLTTLPASMGKMLIAFFGFRNNQISCLPDEISKISGYLFVGGNQICSPSPLVEEWLKSAPDWDDGNSQTCPGPTCP